MSKPRVVIPAFGWAYTIPFDTFDSLCNYAAPSRPQLKARGKPIPTSRAVKVTIVPEKTFDRLVNVARQVARGGECTCHDLGEGYKCDVCEAKAVLALLAEKS